jgi:hypothetical protein
VPSYSSQGILKRFADAMGGGTDQCTRAASDSPE